MNVLLDNPLFREALDYYTKNKGKGSLKGPLGYVTFKIGFFNDLALDLYTIYDELVYFPKERDFKDWYPGYLKVFNETLENEDSVKSFFGKDEDIDEEADPSDIIHDVNFCILMMMAYTEILYDSIKNKMKTYWRVYPSFEYEILRLSNLIGQHMGFWERTLEEKHRHFERTERSTEIKRKKKRRFKQLTLETFYRDNSLSEDMAIYKIADRIIKRCKTEPDFPKSAKTVVSYLREEGIGKGKT